MPRPNVELTESRLSVAPGGRVATTLRFRNRSPVVGEFRISIPPHCLASRWVNLRVVSPHQGKPNPLFVSVSFLRDKQEAEVELVFEPPSSPDLPSGPTRFVVAVDARDKGNESTSVEGEIDIAGTPSVDTRLFVDRRSGRRSGLYRLGAVNTGNTAVEVALKGEYEPSTTSVAWTPTELRLAPRERGEFLVELKPRNLRPVGRAEELSATLRPQARTRAGEFPISKVEQLVFQQKPIVPSIALPIAALAIGGAVFLAWPEPVEEADPNAPSPPSELAGVADVGSVQVTFRRADLATATQVVVTDCGSWDPLDPRWDEEVEFGEEESGSVPLDDVTSDPFCLAARSSGSAETRGVWSALSAPIVKISGQVGTPTLLSIEGDELVFEEVEVEKYQIIVDNVAAPADVAGSPFKISSLSLGPGEYKFQVRAVGPDGTPGSPSNELSYRIQGAGASLTEEPWVLFDQGQEPIDNATRRNFIFALKQLGGPFVEIYDAIETQQLPETTADGRPLLLQLGPAEIDLGGRYALGYFGGGLSESEVKRLCGTVVERQNELQEDLDELTDSILCYAFDGQGNQLPAG